MVIGTCSLCGGDVTVHEMWAAVTPDVPRCQSCGATAKKPEPPVIPMERTTVGVTRRDGMAFHPRENFVTEVQREYDGTYSFPKSVVVIDLNDDQVKKLMSEGYKSMEQSMKKAIDDLFINGSGVPTEETK